MSGQDLSSGTKKNPAWIFVILFILFVIGILFISNRSRPSSDDKSSDGKSADGKAASGQNVSLNQGKTDVRTAEEWTPKLKVIYTFDTITENGMKLSIVAKYH